MDCSFIRTADGIACEACGFNMSWTRAVLPRRECTKPIPPAPNSGPGTELAAIITLIGGKIDYGCGGTCQAMIDQMNRWGVAGCRVPENRAVIIGQLQTSAAKWGVVEWLAGGWRVATHPGLTVDLLRHGLVRDPIGALVDVAIERSAAATK